MYVPNFNPVLRQRLLISQAKASEGRLLVMESLELPEGKTVRHVQC